MSEYAVEVNNVTIRFNMASEKSAVTSVSPQLQP